MPRLQEIYERTEKWWNDQLKFIPSRRVNYLLIAEAPPWSEYGSINYFYNPDTRPTNLMQAVSKAFFGGLIYKNVGVEETLVLLGQRGFLLCDSIPTHSQYDRVPTKVF